MDEMLVKVLFLFIGLYLGVMSWLAKTWYQEFKALKADYEALKEKVSGLRAEIGDDFEELFDRYVARLDEKLDAWWNKIECNLMNDGRLPPKRTKKEG